MSFGNTFEDDVLQLIFNATSIANVAGPATTGALTNLWVSLHNTSPGETGGQNTGEVTYGGYARVSVARTTGGWSISSGVASPVAAITFGACTAGTATAGYVGIGTASSGAGKLICYGTITPSISISSGVTPSLTTSTTITLN